MIAVEQCMADYTASQIESRTAESPRVISGRRLISLTCTTERMRLIENPVTVAITVVTSASGLPLAMLVIPRSSAAPPHPTSCKRQKARFLSAKKGAGVNGSMAIDPAFEGAGFRVARLAAAGRERDVSQLRTGLPPRLRLRSLRGRLRR